MRFKLTSVFALAAVLVGACQTGGQLAKDDVYSANSQKGLIVMGVQFGPELIAEPSFLWLGRSLKFVRPKSNFGESILSLGSHLQNQKQYLVFELDPGVHILRSVVMKDSSVNKTHNLSPTIKISVEPGKAVYLGQYYVDQTMSLRRFTFKITPPAKDKGFKEAEQAMALHGTVSVPLEIAKIDYVKFVCTGTSFLGIGDKKCKLEKTTL